MIGNVCSRKYFLRGFDRHNRVASEAELRWLSILFSYIYAFFARNDKDLEADALVIRSIRTTLHIWAGRVVSLNA